MTIPEYPRNQDGTYGPVKNKDHEHYYISKADHRLNAKKNKHKSRWCIKENQEFHLFKIADECDNVNPRWFCNSNNCLFSLLNKAKVVLGRDGERIAKFPLPPNVNDAWHGYPVECKYDQNIPGEELLDEWEKHSIITKSLKRRIETRKL